MMSLLFPLYVIPSIILVIVGAGLIRKRGNPETAERRYFLFLAWAAIGMTVPILVNWLFPQLRFSVGIFLVPLLPAVVAMMLLKAKAWFDLSGKQKGMLLFVFVLLVLISAARFLFGSSVDNFQRLDTILVVTAFVSLSVYLFIVWKWGKRLPFVFGFASILFLVIFNWFEVGYLSLPDEATLGSISFVSALTVIYLVIPGIVMPTMAMFVMKMAEPMSEQGEPVKASRWRNVVPVLMVLALLGLVIYTIIWLWIWDGMDDGVRFILLWMAMVMSAISVGLVIGMTSSGWRRLIGIPFAGVILALVYGSALGIGNRYSNDAVTEDRAQQIQKAIESFHAKTSWYPLDLNELTPGEMLRIPRPMIVPGEKWCYQGSSNYYRLGLVYREHWSSPYFSVRVYASAGDVPDTDWECEERLVNAKAVYAPDLYESPFSNSLPESSVSIPKTSVEPILSGKTFSVGDWSPDGRYLVFGKTEYSMDNAEQVNIDLQFIDSTNGNICQPPESQWTLQGGDGLRGHHAWLPDGRFLYVTDAGEIWTFKPCSSNVEDLASRFSNTFTGIVSFDEKNGMVLLKDEGGYWLLNGSSFELRKIADVPTENYRDWYAWSTDGKRLAISILMGAEEGSPASLYVVNTETGDMEFEQPLQGVSDAYLPIVEWMSPDELLLHSKTLTIMDFRTNPPAMTDLIHDIFLLDIEYPTEISAMDSHQGADGYTIGIRVNLPHNQNAYLYDSKTKQVSVYEQDVHSLFFFPDGGWMLLPKWEDTPTYTDEYEMTRMDRPDEERRLIVEGHVPRNSPQMFPRYLPEASQLVFSSSQGVSLVSMADGKTLRFWTLRGAERYFSRVSISPTESAIIVFTGEVGVYYLPLTGMK